MVVCCWLLVVSRYSNFIKDCYELPSTSPATNILEIGTRGGREFKDKKRSSLSYLLIDVLHLPLSEHID
jgi:hypothetical protein